MSGWAETVNCPRCGEESLEASQDGHDQVAGECIECGYAYGTFTDLATLEEVNDLRKDVGMEPLTELRSPLPTWTEDNPLVEHQYDCDGSHRIVCGTVEGDTSGYSQVALLIHKEHIFIAFTPYYEGELPHENIAGVYELDRVGEDAKNPVAYSLRFPDAVCPYVEEYTPCHLVGICPQAPVEEPE